MRIYQKLQELLRFTETDTIPDRETDITMTDIIHHIHIEKIQTRMLIVKITSNRDMRNMQWINLVTLP